MPDLLERFLPKFDTLFLGVKETDPLDLTKSDNPFGWLLKVLQHEDANEETIRETMQEVLAHIESLDTLSAWQQQRAILYIYQLVFYRRPAIEREGLYTFIATHTQHEEIKEMVMTSAEALFQEGIEKGAKENAIDSILLVLDTRFEIDDGQTLQSTLESIDNIQRLKHLLRLATDTATLDAFIESITTRS